MTAQAATSTTRDARRERLAVAWVVLVWVGCLAVGWTYHYLSETATRHVTRGEVSVAAPAAWIVEGAAGNLLLVVRNPTRSEETYSVLRLPQTYDSLDAAAKVNRSLAATQRQGYLIADIVSTDLGGAPADRTTYSFVRRDAAGRTALFQGVDYVVRAGSTAFAITFVSPVEAFDRDLPSFERFARSVRLSGQ